ncbi:hypothetical protein [Dysgonomonas sp.]
MTTEIKPNNRFVKMAYYISQLQDEVQIVIDETEKNNDLRMSDFAERLVDIQNYLSGIKGEIGDQIGGLIIDQIDDDVYKHKTELSDK